MAETRKLHALMRTSSSNSSLWSQHSAVRVLSPAASQASTSPFDDNTSQASLSADSLVENALGSDLSVERCPADPSSFASPDEVTVAHMDFWWNVNFRRTRLEDTWKLVIKNVTTLNGVQLEYTIHPHLGYMGSKLEIFLPAERGDPDAVKIEYHTSRHAKALEWVLAEHTEGKKFPFMFSQCECIRCRSIIPCQDTPTVKTTYTAKVAAPMDLTVLMSATKKGKIFLLAKNRKLHSFVQNVPIPSYLIAIAVGDFVFWKLGPRTRVWCEPPLLEKAAAEFQATENLLEAAESICGPYVWERYHLLVMPHAFTFVAMENPGITFVNQTVLAGDESSVQILAHEIAHSWMGNLVTNCNFEHFWLNEGVCTFVERKILGSVLGRDFRRFLSSRGMKRLRDVIRAKGVNHPHTKLVVDLKYTSPDALLSVVPYEKGHTFMYYLEMLVGNSDNFDNFLKNYVETFKIQSIDSNVFKNYFCDYFASVDAVSSVDWDAWFYNPGMPPMMPNYRTWLEEECQDLKNKWLFWDGETPHTFTKEDISSMCPTQVQEFLELMSMVNLPFMKLTTMEKTYSFLEAPNVDIRYRWLLLCIYLRYRDIIPYALGFVQHVGRLAYIVSIYRALYEWEDARDWTIRVFVNTYKTMSRRTARLLSKELNVELNI